MSAKIWCFFGVHEYEIVRQGSLNIYGLNNEVVRNHQYYDLRCKVCGRMKMKKL